MSLPSPRSLDSIRSLRGDKTSDGNGVGQIFGRGYKMSGGALAIRATANNVFPWIWQREEGFPSENRLISRVNGEQREIERCKKKKIFFFVKRKFEKSKGTEDWKNWILLLLLVFLFYFNLWTLGIRGDRRLDYLFSFFGRWYLEGQDSMLQRYFLLRLKMINNLLTHDDIFKEGSGKYYSNLSSIWKFI